MGEFVDLGGVGGVVGTEYVGARGSVSFSRLYEYVVGVMGINALFMFYLLVSSCFIISYMLFLVVLH
jgi:hypothetical protein